MNGIINRIPQKTLVKSNYLLLLSIVLLLIATTGCSNLLTRKRDFPLPDVVVFTCNGADYSSDKDFIRAMGSARSRNEAMSVRMADHDASVNLAKAIDNYIQKVERHKDRQQMEQGEAAMEWENESVVRENLEMNMQNVATICTETQPDDVFFNTTVIVEIPVESALSTQVP